MRVIWRVKVGLDGKSILTKLPKGWVTRSVQPNGSKPELNVYIEVDDSNEKEDILLAVIRTGVEIPKGAAYQGSLSLFHVFKVPEPVNNVIYLTNDF